MCSFSLLESYTLVSSNTHLNTLTPVHIWTHLHTNLLHYLYTCNLYCSSNVKYSTAFYLFPLHLQILKDIPSLSVCLCNFYSSASSISTTSSLSLLPPSLSLPLSITTTSSLFLTIYLTSSVSIATSSLSVTTTSSLSICIHNFPSLSPSPQCPATSFFFSLHSLFSF